MSEKKVDDYPWLSETNPRKMVRSSIAIALGIICIILVVGLVGEASQISSLKTNYQNYKNSQSSLRL